MAAQRVLVTGARGFIGGFLCKRLLAEGHTVAAMATTENNTQYLRDMRNGGSSRRPHAA